MRVVNDNNALEKLSQDPAVDYVEPNRIRSATAAGAPSDPKFAQQWALQRIEAAAAWRLIPGRFFDSDARRGRVRIAILDSGADCRHPDFINAGGSSADAALGGQIRFSLSQALVPTAASTATCEWNDDNGHGTHVAAIAAASANNGQGIAGAGYPVELLIYKVLDGSGNGDDLTISNAIVKATDAGARIISMSLGWSGYSQTLQNAINYAWERGVLVIAAAGNQASSEPFYPAASNHVLAVAATNADDEAAPFSNHGSFIDVAAPGTSILSAAPVGRWELRSGTSMATPMVAGVAGLVAMATPRLSADAIARRIEQSAETPRGAWPRINARRAVVGELRAAETGNLGGQIVDSNGQPVAGIPLTVSGRSWTTGTNGLFSFGGLPVGAHTLSVDGVEWNVTVVAGATATVTPMTGVALQTYSGTVMSGGLPVAGAVVEAVAGGRIRAAVFTAPDGSFSLRLRQAEGVELRASEAGYVTSVVPVDRDTKIVLAKLGEIRGVVRDSKGAPSAGVPVRVESGSSSAGAVTNADGSFATPGLPAAAYSVTAEADGQVDLASTVEVSDGAIVNLTLQAAPPARPVPSAAFLLMATAHPLSVSWSTPEAAGSIGLFQGEVKIASVEVNGQAAGSATLDLALAPGNYSFRYLNEANAVLGVSNVIQIRDAASASYWLSAKSEAGILKIAWTAPEGRPKNDWIGVFRTGTDAYSAVWWKWTEGVREGSASIKLPKAGVYEIRYFPNGEFEPIALSETFEVR